MIWCRRQMQTRRLQYIHMFHVELGDRGFALRVAASCRALSFSAPTTWRRGGVGGVSVRGAARADFTGRVYAQSAESLEKERITIRWVLTALLSVTDESPRMMNSCTLSPPSSPSPLPRSLSPSLHTSLSEIHSWASTSLQAASLYCLH